MTQPVQPSRRRFLKQSGALSAAGAVGGSWLLNLAAAGEAAAATGGPYKALVCVFLYGGNDACNTVLPLDAGSWTQYDRLRSVPPNTEGSTADLRLPREQLRPISAVVQGQAVQYGLHPNLGRVQSLYQQGKLAVVANVGSLIKAPLTRNDLTAPTNPATESNGQLPPKLRSHNDQQVVWQSGRSNLEERGWGGRTVDPVAYDFPSEGAQDKANSFSSVYFGDSPAFSYGDTTVPYGMTTGGNGVVPLLPGAGGKLYGGAPISVLKDLITATPTALQRTNLIEQDYITLTRRSLDAEAYMTGKLSAIPLNTVPVPANNHLANQLKMVARVIKAHSNRNGRQVFFVAMYGFDTHDGQRAPDRDIGHDLLMRQLDEALGYFSDVLGSDMDKVTTFTASDFGRLLGSNGDGTDHAWGGHHFVMGGAVDGGKVFGRMPSYERSAGGSSYVDQQMTEDGAMIPVVSVGSYGATLARWFGATEAEAKAIFPYLYAQGSVSPTNVGFMKGI